MEFLPDSVRNPSAVSSNWHFWLVDLTHIYLDDIPASQSQLTPSHASQTSTPVPWQLNSQEQSPASYEGGISSTLSLERLGQLTLEICQLNSFGETATKQFHILLSCSKTVLERLLPNSSTVLEGLLSCSKTVLERQFGKTCNLPLAAVRRHWHFIIHAQFLLHTAHFTFHTAHCTRHSPCTGMFPPLRPSS